MSHSSVEQSMCFPPLSFKGSRVHQCGHWTELPTLNFGAHLSNGCCMEMGNSNILSDSFEASLNPGKLWASSDEWLISPGASLIVSRPAISFHCSKVTKAVFRKNWRSKFSPVSSLVVLATFYSADLCLKLVWVNKYLCLGIAGEDSELSCTLPQGS